MGRPLSIGVIGVGVISKQYFEHFPQLPNLALTAVADLDLDRASAVAAEQGVEALTVDALLTDPRVDAVLNLTIPAAHAEIALRALDAGKHVYGEKPLALSTAEAAPILERAAARGLRVGSAPDTVLGTGVQTARALLDEGAIGDPVAAAVTWTAPGHELWHPAPAFYYQPGGGPLFDMGPYYLTSLVTFFGPVVRGYGAPGRATRERRVATGPLAVSFEVWASRAPKFEVYGTAGTLAVPDPNMFSDTVQLATADDREFHGVDPVAGYADAGRGYGLADLARAIETDRPERASGQLAFHVLEIMESVLRAGATHEVVELRSTVERPATVPHGARPDTW